MVQMLPGNSPYSPMSNGQQVECDIFFCLKCRHLKGDVTRCIVSYDSQFSKIDSEMAFKGIFWVVITNFALVMASLV